MVETRSARRRSIAPDGNSDDHDVPEQRVIGAPEMIRQYEAVLAEEKAWRERNLFTRVAGKLQDVHTWFTVSLALYMLDPWEKVLVWLATLLVTTLAASSIIHVLQLMPAVPGISSLANVPKYIGALLDAAVILRSLRSILMLGHH